MVLQTPSVNSLCMYKWKYIPWKDFHGYPLKQQIISHKNILHEISLQETFQIYKFESFDTVENLFVKVMLVNTIYSHTQLL